MAHSEDLWNAELAFAAATGARGLEGWVEAFAEDGAQLHQGGGISVGPDAIRSAMAGAFGDPYASFTWQPLRAEATPSGDFGFTYGRWTVTRRETRVAAGKYMSVWRRDGRGLWKVVADIGHRDEPHPGDP